MSRSIAVAAALSFFACSQSGTAADPAPVTPPSTVAAAPDETESPRGPVIATMMTHDARVSILGHGGDLRVIVKKTDGTILANGVTIEELATKDPEAYRLVKNATAHTGDYLDATGRAPRAPSSPGIDARFDARLDR